MLYNAGRVTKVESRRIYYMLDRAGGQSGSPTWRYRYGKRHAVGIHAYGGCPNKSTRISKAVFDNMKKRKTAWFGISELPGRFEYSSERQYILVSPLWRWLPAFLGKRAG